ncbi:MAG: hypothetical protein MRZ75_10820 [Roseburia sp.]|nr:hypothetical protein [Roseburia sp.]MDY5884225.1 hypothetical protein [Roseburia sp.]
MSSELTEAIVRYEKLKKKEIEDSRKKEKHQVAIAPDSYIGREINYQTALLHEIKDILDEIRNDGSKSHHLESEEAAGEYAANTLFYEGSDKYKDTLVSFKISSAAWHEIEESEQWQEFIALLGKFQKWDKEQAQ